MTKGDLRFLTYIVFLVYLETIFVDLELQNPLKIPFQLTNLQLLAAFMIL